MTDTAWEYAKASDRVLGEEPSAFADSVSDMAKLTSGAVFLRSNQQRLEIWWHEQFAVVGHADSDDNDLDCALTESSLDQSASIPSASLIEWTCSCCGVTLGCFTQPMHIQRDVAFEIFKHVLVESSRPQTSNDGPITWSQVEAD